MGETKSKYIHNELNEKEKKLYEVLTIRL